MGVVDTEVSGTAPARGADERRRGMEAWNRPASPREPQGCVHQLFEAHAARTPDAVAVVFPGGSLCCAELNERANRLAHHLRRRGVGPEVRVGVCMERGAEMAVAILAVLKAGGAYLPLDPAYPAERLEMMVADSGVALLLTQESLRPVLPAGAEVLSVDGARAAVAAESAENPDSGVTRENLAYVIYTSGSTGRPKGVGVTHRGLRNTSLSFGRMLGVVAGSRFLQFASPSFDASVCEVFVALVAAAEVHLAPREALLPGPGLLELLAGRGITHAILPPSTLAVLPPAELPALGTLIVAGEACPPELVRRWGAGRRFVNAYGPTEAAICATATACEPDGRTPPIGPAIDGATAHVLDPRLHPATEGELYVGGEGVARGYLNRAALTAERFVPDPFSADAGARMYRTGDRVRVRADGALEFIGRMDEQVKVRGHRVEPGEVEDALAAHPALAHAAVVARADAAGGVRLVAYAVPREGAAVPATGELRAFLARTLPEYMIPSAFVGMQALPLTPNGKVNRRALPAPDEARPALAAAYVPPRTGTERRVAAVWAEVLGIEGIGAEDGFFELGGHSLAATQVVSRLRHEHGVEVPLAAVLGGGTLAHVARAADEAGTGAPAFSPVLPAPRDGHLPLSFSQERVWFLTHLAPDNLSYHAHAALVFRGALDVPALEAALSSVVARHEILRTTFPTLDGRPAQHIHAPWAVRLDTIDFTHLPADEREDAARGWMRTDFGRRFDLAQLPLVRWTLLRTGEDEHRLVHVEHHIIHDGWSFNLLLRDLLDAYRAASQGRAADLPVPEVQFADYCAWQREWMRTPAARAQLDFWRRKLAGSPPVLELPTDRPRPAAQRFHGAAPRFHLSGELYRRLRALGHAEGATLYMTMLAGFNALLSRWSGQDDVSVGTGIAVRRQHETEGMLGMFVNSLVLRTDLSGEPTFRELLARVRSTTLDAYAHQDVPFEAVVDAVRPDRTLGHNPLFQAMFSFHDSTQPDLSVPGAEVELQVALSNQSAKFDLNVVAIPHAEQRARRAEAGAEGITLVWEYDTDLFDTATIERMFRHFRALLEAAAADPDAPVSGLAMLADDEADALLAAGRAARTFPVAERIHQRFERRAAERPDAPALTFAGESLGYAELNARANRLARHLRSLGVGPETRVGLCLERSAELVVAILGVLKAGGGYVPLDPAYPAERIAFVLEDAGVPVLITQSRLLADLPDHGARAVCIDGDADEIARESAENLDVDAGADSLAYVIYTSGSTGKPKGVQVTHANVVRLFDATDAWFGFGAEDVWTLFHSCAFDFSVWEIWGALLYGGRLVVVPFLTTRSPEDFHRLLVVEGVTVLNQTPSAFRQLIEADRASEVHPSALSLRCVVFGGEALDPRALAPWMDRHGDERPRLVNMYGITETTVHVTYRRITRGDLERPGSPIGVPIPDLSLHVLDRHLRPVPAGVAGELFVGGAGVARGYLNRPELTAERFLRDPFAYDLEARLYRTGDRARRRADGEVEYLGRADQQVKVRGFRIEPGEIEAALCAHPAVARAAVVVREDPGEEKRLVAYVVPAAGAEAPEAAELRPFLAASLPDHMVPGAFVALDTLPLTAHGKLDVRALPAPGDRHAAAAEYTAPRTPAEALIARVWSEMLGVERVGIDDNYFALGGDSIRSVRVIAAARQRGVQVSTADLFRNQTVRELAAVARLAADAGPAPAAEAALEPFALLADEARRHLPADVEDAYPVSQVQLAMLYHTERAPDSLTYLNLNGYLVHSRWDERAFAEAVSRVAAAHPVLRTSFDVGALPEPVQRVHRRVEIPLEVSDLRRLDRAAQDARFHALRYQSFDFTRAPLARFHVHLLSDEVFRVVLGEHHAVLDGWSVASLMTELLRRFVALRDGAADPAGPPPAARFADFVALERQAMASAESRAFWRRVAEGAPESLLPPREAAPAQAADELCWLRLEVPAGTAEALRRVADAAGVPLKTVLLAAHLRVLALLGGADEVVTGYVTSGRPEARDGERVLGLFLNTVPLRVRVQGGTWRELLRAVWRAEEEMVPHRRFPLAEIVHDAGGRIPFETAFNFNHFHVFDALAADGVRLEPDLAFQKTEMALLAAAGVNPATGELRLRLEYDSARLAAAQVAALGELYLNALSAAAGDPDTPLRALPLVPPARREALLAAGRPTRAFPVTERIHERFERRAAERPEAPAVTFGAETLSYGELNARANRLAHRLIALGVGPEARVGLCLERSAEMVVAILAVLKAGGGYVPLDPAYPAERIAFVLEDAAIPVLVTEAAHLDTLPPHAAETICVDRDAVSIAGESAENPASAGAPDALAYVIYTSGSTGRPKGVQVTHASVVRLLDSTDPWYRFGTDEVWTLFHSFAFDVSVFEMWGALLYGGRLVVVPFLTTRSPDDFHRLLVDEGVTVLSQTPSAFRPLIQADLASGVPPSALALRWVLFAGEALDPQSLRAWMDRHGDRRPRLINMYGITETTVHATYREITRAELELGGSPIGVSFPDQSLYVLDRDLEPVPTSVPGELFVGGPGVARGYLNRPELTAERFIRDPFSADPQARLYRSGDRARRRADGELEYLGRADQQVKIRGFRIETGEIEAALAAHPAVAEAAVVPREEAGGEKRLVAYVVPPAGTPAPGTAELRPFLAARLPDYMVPAAFVALDALPLTANGKLDRRALPAPGAAESGAPWVAPRTEAEAALAAVWGEVLGVERVGIDDGFFALGGDSIRAVRVVARAREHGVAITLPQLFQLQTIRLLAASPDGAAEAAAGDCACPQEPFAMVADEARWRLPAGLDDAYPLTRLQLGMLYHSEIDSERVRYRWVAGYRLETAWDEDALRQAVRRLFARHPALRTSFDLAAVPEPLQRVHAEVELPLEVDDLRLLSPKAQEAAMDAWMREEAERPFDWTVPPLVRFQVHRLGDGVFRFTVSQHHAVLDGWSVATLLTELFRHYAALRDGTDDPTGEAPRLGFREFVALERRALASPETRGWWARTLDGAETTFLPREGALPAGETHGCSSHEAALPAETSAAVRRVAERAGVPLKSVLLAAHLRVLAALGGRRQVLTGLVTHGRPEAADGERILGLFLNTAPLVARVEDGSWADLARAAFHAEREMLPHRRFPLAEAQRIAGRAPLVDVAFNYLHFHVYEDLQGMGGMAFQGARVLHETEFSLVAGFSTDVSTGLVRLRLEYDPAALDADGAAALARRYERVLAAMSADPDAPHGATELLSDDERAALLAWGTGEAVRPDGATLPALFDAQARRTPDAVALVAGGERLTYGELRERADRLARRLRASGVEAGTVVGVCTGRSAEMVVGLLGTMRAGGVYLPLDPAYPAERLAYMLADSGARVAATTGALADRLPAGTPLLLLDGDDGAPLPAPAEVRAEHAAYLIYTSGSTGAPKGVVVGHAEAAAHCAAAVRAFGLTADDAVLAFASASFDVSLEQVLPPLSVGARVVVRGEEVPTPAELAALARDEGVTVINPPTAYWHQLVADPVSRAALRQARLVIGGGDVMHPEAVRAWEDTEGPARLVNAYGPTETLITAAAYEVPAGFDGERVPVGRPFPGRRLYVVGETGELLPAGVPGELCIGGPLLARGYLGRPEATAERFVRDPFAAGGARMYRTGDRARWRADGTLEFLGRLDAQVKVRGFRIELGEVEAALRAHPEVREAAAAVHEEAPGQKVLAGYAVPREGAVLHAAGLREFLAGRLPPYAVPTAFAVLPELPLTPNGKVDRAALPAPAAEAGGAPYEAPRTPAEELLATLFAEVLGVSHVAIRDDFFALGGHSLGAMRLVARVRDLFRVELPLRALFEAPTVAAMAERVEAERRGGAALLPPLRPRGETGPAPLAFAQRRLWFLDRMEPGRAHYNVLAVVRLRGSLDRDALNHALTVLVARHEALRTVFRAADGGEPMQVVLGGAGFHLSLSDLSQLPAERAEAEALRAVEADVRRPFDLADGPLFRALLVREGAEHHLLALTLHHTVGDGASLRILFGELSALYGAFVHGRANPLPAPALHYGDYAAWQRAWLTDERLAAQVEWWRAALAGAPPALTLPTDRPRPAAQSHRGALHLFELDASAGPALRALGRSSGATLFMTLLAAFQVVLSRWSGQDEVVVGTPVAGRAQSGTEGMVGLFVNTLPVRGDLAGEPSFRELLGRVREAVLGTLAHQDVPFERLVEELRPDRSLARQPVFQVVFALNHDGATDALALEGLSSTRVPVDGGSAKFDLMLAVAEREGALSAAFEYATDLFDAGTMERMADQLRTLLAAAAANPDAPISTLPLVDPAERARLLAAGAATAEVPVTETLHARFAARAARTPDAVAVTFESAALTYGELDSRANRLARHLQSRGVGPETRVGLCLERSLEMVVAILGVLKAGGAYVPLDPAYPAERLAYVLEDAGIGILLTQERLLDALPATGAAAVCLDRDWPAIAAESDEAPASGAVPGNTAYVIYTSGSTGKPKGCAVTHANAVRLFTSTDGWFGFGADDVWTLFHSYAFDFSVWEIWGALLYGGRLVVVPFLTSRAPDDFYALLEAEGVTVLSQTPGAFGQLARVDEEAAARGAARRLALRWVVFGGEALEPASLRGWVARRGDEAPRLINMYGITETTVHVTFRPVTRAEVEGGASSVIGIPLPDLSLHLLDVHGEPAPIGVPGEMYVGGAGVSLGYPGRPSLTAQRFVPDPFAGVPGARLYRSGDLARRRTDGDVEYLGRIDDQVKVRGFRIEPGEIEAAMGGHPGVAQAAVVVDGTGAGTRLLAFFTPAPGAAPTAAVEVREWLRARLPEHLVPAGVQAMDAFPLTPNGKTDRRALAAAWSGPESGAAHVPPRGEVEAALAEVFAEVLQAERVGAHDGFFELGGHSLLAIRAAGRLTELFRFEVPVRLVFEAPTVAAMAEGLEAREPRPGQVRTVAKVLARLRAMDTAQVRAALSPNDLRVAPAGARGEQE